MSTPNDGGPAFPGVEGSYGNGNMTPHGSPNGETCWIAHNQGMTLRDYFAGQALPSVMADHYAAVNDGRACTDESEIPESAARCAYIVADAMIAARKEKP